MTCNSDAELEHAITAGIVRDGTVYGPVISDADTGEECRLVYEYENGECTDRFVTIVRYADE